MPSIDIKITGDTGDLQSSLNNVQRQLNALQSAAEQSGDKMDTAFDTAEKEAQDAGKAVEGLVGDMAGLEKAAMKVGKAVGAYFALDQIMAFGRACLEVRKEFESLEVSFATLLGSETAGKAMFDQLTEFATKTPMMEKDIASAAQTLLGFNIAAEKVVPLLKAIGDVSMGDAQKFQSLSLAFAQATSAGKLMGQDLMQMINAGFNPLGEMSRTTGKSISELKDQMEKGGISAQMLEDAFVSATSEGGKFNGMLEKQAATMGGAMSNLEGAIQKFEGALGKAVEPVFVEIVNKGYETVNELTEAFETLDIEIDMKWLEEMAKVIEQAVIAFGAYKAAEIAIGAVTTATNFVIGVQAAEMGALAQAHLVASLAIAKVTKSVKAMTAAMVKNPWTLAAAAIAYAVSEIVMATQEIEKLEYEIRSLDDAMKEGEKNTAEEITQLELYRKTAEDTNATIEDRKKAVDALQGQYPDYFKNLSAEQIMCGDVGNAYQELSRHILEAAQAKAAFEMMKENAKEILRLQQQMDSMDKETVRRGQQIYNARKKRDQQIKQDRKSQWAEGMRAAGVGGVYGQGYMMNDYLGKSEQNAYNLALKYGAAYNAIQKIRKEQEKLSKIAKDTDPFVNAPTIKTPSGKGTSGKGTSSGTGRRSSGTGRSSGGGKTPAELRKEAEERLQKQYEEFGQTIESVSEHAEGEIVKAYQRTIANSMELRIDTLDSEHEDMLEAIKTNTDAEKRALEASAEKIYEAQLALEIAQGKRKKTDKPAYSRELLKSVLPELAAVLQAQEDALDEAASNLTDFENASYLKQWRDLYDELLAVKKPQQYENLLEGLENQLRTHRAKSNTETNSELLYLQKLLDSIAARIAEIEYEYDELKDKLKGSVYSFEKASIYQAMNESLEIENSYLNDYLKLQEKIVEAGGAVDKSIKSYQDKLRANNKLIMENGEAMVEAIMGEDVKAAIARFADAVSDSWTKESTIKDSARNAVKTMIKNMVTESLKQDLSEPVRQLQERMMAMYNSKGFMTQQDMARFESEAEQLAKQMEAKYGFMDEMLKDMNATFDGTKGAFRTMSQESADELNGRFAQTQQAVQGTYDALLQMTDEMGMANNALNAINNAFSNLEDNVALANGYLYSIDANMAKMAKEVIPSLHTIEMLIKRDR